MKRPLFFIAFSFFFSAYTFAQTTDWQIFQQQVYPYPIVFQENIIWAIEKLGLLQLNKDSGQWRLFHSANSPLQCNQITSITVDAQNRLWVAPAIGPVWIVQNENWVKVDRFPDGNLIGECTGIQRDQEGNIWLWGKADGANDSRWYMINNNVWNSVGVNQFNHVVPIVYKNSNNLFEFWWSNKDTLKYSGASGVENHLLPNSLKNCETAGGEVFYFNWLAPKCRLADGRIFFTISYYYIYNQGCPNETTGYFYKYLTWDGSQWQTVLNDVFPSPDINQTFFINNPHGGSVFFKKDGQTYSYDGEQLIPIQLQQCESCFDPVYYDGNGGFWGTTLNCSVGNRYQLQLATASDCKTYPFFSDARLPYPVLDLIRPAKNGDVWVVNKSNGLSLFSQGDWTVFPSNAFVSPGTNYWTNEISEIAVDNAGLAWLGFKDSHINSWQWDGYQWHQNNYPAQHFAFEPSTGVIWYTYDNTLHRKSVNFDTEYNSKNTTGIPESGFDELIFDRNGKLWALNSHDYPDNGIYRKSDNNGSWMKIPDDGAYFYSSQFYDHRLLFDDSNCLWIFNGNVLLRYNSQNWQTITLPLANNNAYINGLSLENGGILWATTSGSQIFKLDANGSSEQVNVLNSQCNDVWVGNITVDSFGNKWMCASNGLIVYREDGVFLPTSSVGTSTVVNESNKGITAIPNPFSDKVELKLNVDILGFQPITWKLFDTQGSLVGSGNIQENDVVDISGKSLVPGLYYIQLTGFDKAEVVKLIRE